LVVHGLLEVHLAERLQVDLEVFELVPEIIALFP